MPDQFRRRDLLLGTAALSLAEQAAAAPEICFLPALEIARLIRQKKLSAREAMQAHLKQIETVNPKVNAIVTLVADQALENAKKADEAQARGETLGPLHGLPVAHKDLVETKGIRTTFGSPLYRDNVPKEDAILIEKIRSAGAITVGKTNTPEFGAGSQTFNRVFGATRNPYDLTKTCGGSSGGAAVSLACGMVPIADGSDTGGSLRNPASFCSIVGFRTAPGRVARKAVGLAWSPLSVAGPMARNVADVALFLSAIAGPDPRCPISISQPGSQFTAPLARDFKGVRVAWFRNLGGIPFDPRIRQVVDARRKVFEDLGCIVEQSEPDFGDADAVFKTLRAFEFEAAYGERLRAHRDQFKDTIQWEVDRGAKLTGSEIAHAQTRHSALWAGFQTFLDRYEYFVLPVTQVPPFSVDQPYVTEIDGVKMETYIDWMKSCYYISIMGNPAISVPCGYTPEGLPVGLQIVGRHQAEFSVLQMAHAFEAATLQARRRPAIV